MAEKHDNMVGKHGYNAEESGYMAEERSYMVGEGTHFVCMPEERGYMTLRFACNALGQRTHFAGTQKIIVNEF